ncbi:UNVERIFIED_CONTAM: hypothetical protein NCL1_20134 [Trichonephila clavipes]
MDLSAVFSILGSRSPGEGTDSKTYLLQKTEISSHFSSQAIASISVPSCSGSPTLILFPYENLFPPLLNESDRLPMCKVCETLKNVRRSRRARRKNLDLDPASVKPFKGTTLHVRHNCVGLQRLFGFYFVFRIS